MSLYRSVTRVRSKNQTRSTYASRLLKRCSSAIGLTLFITTSAMAYTPNLAFSDLISGPSTGLGDGQGSGVIVTVWGQNLGNSQEDGTLIFRDSAGTTHEPHVYYWKPADGQLPSGPADLFTSHRMQEIAFSIPDAASGAGEILVQVNGDQSNALPFTVRSGDIHHVRGSGNDRGDGLYQSPWRTAEYAVSRANAGATIYIHDVDTGSNNSSRGIYWNNSSATSGIDNQFAVVAYPGHQPKVTAQRAVENYRTEGMVASKLDLYASNYTSVDAYGQPTGSTIDNGSTFALQSSKNGRSVANRMTDIEGGCASRYQGAIVGHARYGDRVSNFRALGNEVYDYGCEGSSKLHHTTYLTVRSGPDNLQVEPWEFGYNYLHGNHAKFGIHQFDQDDGCGDLTGTLRIHNNVIIDQGGAGISIGSQCGWSMDVEIENNVLINVGLAAAWDGKDTSTVDGPEAGGIAIRDHTLYSNIRIRNNLIHGHTTDSDNVTYSGCLTFNSGGDNVSVLWENNICYSELDLPFIGATNRASNKLDNVTGSHNLWYYTGNEPERAIVPEWDTAPVTNNPEITINDSWISLAPTSAAIDNAKSNHLNLDIYGLTRNGDSDIGPVVFPSAAPKPPVNPTLVVE